MNWSPLLISIYTSFFSTILTLIFGVFVAYFMFKYKGPLKDLIDSFLIIPLFLPPTVIGFFLLLMFGKNGCIGKFLYRYFNFSLIFSWPATLLSAVVVSFPLMYKVARFSFEQIDEKLIYSAKILGAKEKRIFFKIILPLAWPGICAGIILSFARSLGEFGATLMIAGNISGKTQTIPIAIYFAVESGNIKEAFVWVLILSFLSIFVIFLINYYNKKQNKIRNKMK